MVPAKSGEDSDGVVTVNGYRIDLANIVSTYGRNRVDALKYLRKITGLPMDEAASVINDAYARFAPASEPPSGFWAQIKENASRQVEAKRLHQMEEKERIAQMDREGIAYCPKCHSTSLSANKKGFGIGKALVGTLIAGPIGLAAGGLGSGKVRVTCLRCGHQFWAGKR